MSTGDLFPRGDARTTLPQKRPPPSTETIMPSFLSDPNLFNQKPLLSKSLLGAASKKRKTSHAASDITRGKLVKNKNIRPHLSLQNISMGSLMLGLVLSVENNQVIIALPDGIIGYLPISDSVIDPFSIQPFLADNKQPPIPSNQKLKLKKHQSSSSDSDDSSSSSLVSKSGSDDAEMELDDAGEQVVSTPSVESLARILSIGQVIRCAIVKVDVENTVYFKKVQLSARLELVNRGIDRAACSKKGAHVYGAIQSIQDHGYVVSFGSHVDFTGFVAFQNDTKIDQKQRNLKIGTTIFATVLKDMSTDAKFRAVPLTLDKAKVKDAVTVEYPSMNLNNLYPGILVSTLVIEKNESGIRVMFLTLFEGTIGIFHSSKFRNIKTEVGAKLLARVLYVDPSLRQVGLTINKQWVKMFQPPPISSQYRPGAFIDDLKVFQVLPHFGVFFMTKEQSTSNLFQENEENEEKKEKKDQNKKERMNDVEKSEDLSIPNTSVFAHISCISDDHIKPEKLKLMFKDGQEARARIININAFDGIIHVSLQESIMSRAVIRYDDIIPGMILKVKIISFTSTGCLIEVEKGIKGFIPLHHLPDMRLKRIKDKYKPGSDIQVRALSVAPEKRRALFTAKKILLESALEPLVSYSQLEKMLGEPNALNNKAFLGVVAGYSSAPGIRVRFYGDVLGHVHINGTHASDKNELEKKYPVGEIVKAYVMGYRPDEKKLSLSLTPGSIQSGLKDVGSIPLGKILQGTLNFSETTKDQIEFIPTGMQGSNAAIKYVVLREHLSDYKSISDRYFDLIAKKKNDDETPISVKHALVYSFLDSENALVTLKYSLIDAAETKHILSDFEQITSAKEKNQLVCGYIRSVTEYGAQIGFLGNLAGYIRRADVSDSFVSDASKKLYPGQSVIGVITSVDPAAKKFYLSLKNDDIRKVNPSQENDVVTNFFKQLESLRNLESGKKASASYQKVGTLVSVVYEAKKPYGILLKIVEDDDIFKDVVAVVPHTQVEDSISLEKTRIKTNAVVIDIDIGTKLVLLSLKKDIVAAAEMKKPKSLECGTNLKCIVELVQNDYIVLREPKKRHFIMSYQKKMNEDAPPGGSGNRLFPGAEVNCRILLSNKHHNIGIIENSNDSKSKMTQNIVGKTVTGRIKHIEPLRLEIKIDSGIGNGVIHATEAVEVPSDDEKDIAKPFMGLKRGEDISAKVAQLLKHDRKHKAFCLTLRSEKTSPSLHDPSKYFYTDAIVLGVVSKIEEEERMWVAVSPDITGRVLPLDASDSLGVIQKGPFANYSIGTPLRCRVLHYDVKAQHLDLSLVLKPPENSICAKIVKVIPGLGLQASVPNEEKFRNQKARIFITDISDDYDEASQIMNGKEKPFVGDYVRCNIINMDTEQNFLDLSMRRKNQTPKDKELCAISDLTVGQHVRGFVKNASKFGVFINIGRKLVARVALSQSTDSFVRDVQNLFSLGQVVDGRILELDLEAEKIEMTLKKQSGKHVNREDLLDKLAEGTIVKGTVKKIEDYGVLIKFNDELVGLCHKSELSDKDFKDVKFASPPVGADVYAVILKINKEKKTVSLGMKESYLHAAGGDSLPSIENLAHDNAMDDDSSIEQGSNRSSDDINKIERAALQGSEDEDSDMQEVNEDIDDSNEENVLLNGHESDSDSDSESDSDSGSHSEDSSTNDEENDVVNNSGKSGKNSRPTLHVDGGFVFEETIDKESPGNDDVFEETKEKKSHQTSKEKRAKKKAKRQMELEIREREEALASSLDTPETSDDFERLLLKSPNSSMIWIRYMSMHVALSEIDMARSLAERALATIDARDERERLNIWIAYINLEVEYGSEASAMSIFKRACPYNDEEELHLRVFKSLSKRPDLAEQIINSAMNKFKTSKEVWTAAGAWRYKRLELEEGRKLLQRALISVPKYEHILVITKFAKLEYEFGSAEQGRTIFEGLVGHFPKRFDLWNIYLDAELKTLRNTEQEKEKTRYINSLRILFDRCCTLESLSTKNMKSIFKRYLDFEKEFGDEEGVEKVKTMAKNFVQSKMQ